jgi:hypothetical protein
MKLKELLRKLILPAHELTPEKKRKKGGILRKLSNKTIKNYLKYLPKRCSSLFLNKAKLLKALQISNHQSK